VSFFRIVTPDDIVNEQKILKTLADSINADVTTCTTLSAEKRAAWTAFYANVVAFCVEVPVWYFPTGANEVVMSSNMLELAQKYEHNLETYRQSLAKECKLVTPAFDPTLPTPMADQTDKLMTVAKYASVAAMFIGTAYVVGKVAEFLPHPSPKAAAKS
jgi:hypothetical protein